jgi:hypothetical protein
MCRVCVCVFVCVCKVVRYRHPEIEKICVGGC